MTKPKLASRQLIVDTANAGELYIGFRESDLLLKPKCECIRGIGLIAEIVEMPVASGKSVRTSLGNVFASLTRQAIISALAVQITQRALLAVADAFHNGGP